MTQPLYKIVKDGQGSGGFLCPPGHPNHEYVVHGYWRGRKKASVDLIASLDYLLTDEYHDVPETVKAQAARITETAELKCSEAWVRSVYGYFRNSYAPESGSRNVADSVRTGPPARHLGYLTVKQYFPEHEPRTDLIANPGRGYGNYPCDKCGQRVQYEARKDAWCTVTTGTRWLYDATCPNGGQHEVAP